MFMILHIMRKSQLKLIPVRVASWLTLNVIALPPVSSKAYFVWLTPALSIVLSLCRASLSGACGLRPCPKMTSKPAARILNDPILPPFFTEFIVFFAFAVFFLMTIRKFIPPSLWNHGVLAIYPVSIFAFLDLFLLDLIPFTCAFEANICIWAGHLKLWKYYGRMILIKSKL